MLEFNRKLLDNSHIPTSRLDTNLLISTFMKFSKLSFEQALEWLCLIEAEERKILSSLKDNVDLEENSEVLALAIASRAFATYIKTISLNLPDTIKTGDISLQKNINQLYQSSIQMEKRYVSLINNLLVCGISPFKEAEIRIE